MRRIRLTVEYDGTNYSGWQRQENAVSVQQRLEEALFRLLKTDTRVTGASRTDAGVHALGQAVHFDTDSRIPPEKYAFALNTMLPDDIRVRTSMAAADDFHALLQVTRIKIQLNPGKGFRLPEEGVFHGFIRRDGQQMNRLKGLGKHAVFFLSFFGGRGQPNGCPNGCLVAESVS